MSDRSDRRDHPRLARAYPIQVRTSCDPAARPVEHTVTQNLSSRGAYFCTLGEPRCRVGQVVSVEISVPHRLAGGERDVVLDLRGDARVVRIQAAGPGLNGEDGRALRGVAVAFDRPLRFRFCWE